MFTPTIYFPEIDSKTQSLALEESKLHHLKKVLRMKEFDNVNISNGQGQLFIGKLVNGSVQITNKKNFQRKNKISIFIPYLREKNRFRFMIEKLTELNVHKIFIGKIEIRLTSVYLNTLGLGSPRVWTGPMICSCSI